MIRLYFIGISILIVAILSNYLIGKIGLISWYDYLSFLSNKKASIIKEVRLIDYIWLFIGYPIVLGIGYLSGEKLFHFIFC